jgi:hypothetical protein
MKRTQPAAIRSSRRARAWIAASLVAASLIVGACATPIGRQALPFESPVIEVAPGAPYQRCVHLETGDRLFFKYSADPPMGFSIRRESGGAIVSFVLRDAAREESGIFAVPQSQDYCLHWTPVNADVPWPTLLRFELRLNP